MSLARLATRTLSAGARCAVGGAAWTLSEYVLHRWIMHGPRALGPAAKEHQLHHAEPALTSPALRAVAYGGVAAAGVGVRRVCGAGVALGWSAGYAAYEQLHWRAHHRPAACELERRRRVRHFAHHFVSARVNFGVTTSLWDRVFGTYAPPAAPVPVPVPRRAAMAWLCDDAGAVRPEHRADYRVVGAGQPSPARRPARRRRRPSARPAP
ncbi:MAG: sterol desaturase family protein, partial [Acidimicrobiales bacterium]